MIKESKMDHRDEGELKPKLRGVSHVVAFFVSLVAGVWLFVQGLSQGHGFVVGVFVVSVSALYGVSATYHFFNWSKKTKAVLKKIDHSLIFVLINGTYTPILWLSLPSQVSTNMLTIVWAIGVFGIFYKLSGFKMPRFFSVGLYMTLGWVSVIVLADLITALPRSALILIFAGGFSYSVGAFCYGLKKPNPFPATFGYHEIFHLFVIVGSVLHFFAVKKINEYF